MKYLVALIAAACLAGCSGQPEGQIEYIYALDRSISTDGNRQKQIDCLTAELDEIPLGSRIVILRFGSTAEEVYSDILTDSGTDTVIDTLENDAKASDPVRGTNFARMAEAVLRHISSSRAQEIHLRFLTDGADDFIGDPQNQSEYSKSAGAVCSDSRIKSMVFVGVKAGFREGVRSHWPSNSACIQIIGK